MYSGVSEELSSGSYPPCRRTLVRVQFPLLEKSSLHRNAGVFYVLQSERRTFVGFISALSADTGSSPVPATREIKPSQKCGGFFMDSRLSEELSSGPYPPCRRTLVHVQFPLLEKSSLHRNVRVFLCTSE